MKKSIPQKYYGEAMVELENSPKVDLLAKCIATKGSTDQGRAEYIAIRAKQLKRQHDKEAKEAENREERLWNLKHSVGVHEMNKQYVDQAKVSADYMPYGRERDKRQTELDKMEEELEEAEKQLLEEIKEFPEEDWGGLV